MTAEPTESSSTPDLSSRNIAGTLKFCDWIKKSNYLGANAADTLKSALKSVFETVEPDTWESISLDGLDVDDYLRRFQFAGGGNRKAETVAVYGKRIRRAIDAHVKYLDTGQPPKFRQPGSNGDASKAKTAPPTTRTARRAANASGHEADVFEASIPLTTGQVLAIPDCPKSWRKRDVERVRSFLDSLADEEPPQLPVRTGAPA